VLVASFAAATLAHGQGWPTKTVKIIVPYPPGGAVDVVTRKMASKLQEQTGQAFIVENKAGATGTIGIMQAIQSPADGYTLVANDSTYALLPHIFKKLPFDYGHDLLPIGAFVFAPMSAVVKAESKYRTLGELIAAAKAAPNSVTYGTGGAGTTPHFLSEGLGIAAGVNFMHVPYKGAGEATLALLSGTTGSIVEGNRIGTDVTGTMPLGNTGRGVAIVDATDNRIGGTDPNAGNLISGNGTDGVIVRNINTTTTAGNRILGNSIVANGGLGIALDIDGPDTNDALDGDPGPNNLQNYPVLDTPMFPGGSSASGTLASTPGRTYRIEVFGNTVEGNFNGVTVVQQNRAEKASYGPHMVDDVWVHDNDIDASGLTGFAQDIGDTSLFNLSIVKFTGNRYQLGTSKPFHWMNGTRTETEWKGYGQDQSGTFAR